MGRLTYNDNRDPNSGEFANEIKEVLMKAVFYYRETLKLVKNPVVALSTLERGIDMVSQLKDPFATYKNPSGIFDKGDSKLAAKLIKFSGISGTNFDPENAIKFMQQNK